jgi:hypothetical protein
MAQVIPVVALAVIVEARALSSHWEAATPDWLRISQSTIWATSLLALVLGEWLTFGALRGRDVVDWLPTALAVVVGLAFSNLITGPALELFAKGNAGPLSYLLTRHPILRFKLRGARRAARNLAVVTQQGIDELTKEESRLVDTVTTLDNAREGLDGADAAMRAALKERSAFMAQHPGVDVQGSASDTEIADMFEQTAAARESNAESRAVVVKDLERVRAAIEETRLMLTNALDQVPKVEQRLKDVVRQEQEALRLAIAAYPLNPNPERNEAPPVAEPQRTELGPTAQDDPADER